MKNKIETTKKKQTHKLIGMFESDLLGNESFLIGKMTSRRPDSNMQMVERFNKIKCGIYWQH